MRSEGRAPASAASSSSSASSSAAAAASWDADALYLSAGRGQLEEVRRLLGLGADANARTTAEFGRTPLMAAALSDEAEVAQLLLASGAVPGARDTELGSTAALLAAQQRSAKVLRLLAATPTTAVGLHAFNDAGYSALFWCVELDELQSALCIVAASDRRQLDAANAGGWTALHLCCRFGRPSIAASLLEAGASANPQPAGAERHSPFTLAAACGRVQLLPLLADHGADVLHTAEGGGALQLATGQAEAELCVRRLLARHEQQQAEQRQLAQQQQQQQQQQQTARRQRTQRAANPLIRAASPLIREAEAAAAYYPCGRRPRGLCVLAHVGSFQHEFDHAPRGADWLAAVASAADAFRDLGFAVRELRDQSARCLRHRLQAVAERQDLRRHDMLLLLLMSYASADGAGVVAADGRSVGLREAAEPLLLPAACPALAGKPKLLLCLLTPTPPKLRRRRPAATSALDSVAHLPDAFVCRRVDADAGASAKFLGELCRRLRLHAADMQLPHIVQAAADHCSSQHGDCCHECSCTLTRRLLLQ